MKATRARVRPYDRSGNKVILRGINLPLLDDWDFPGSDYLDQLVQSGANAVRIQWYINYPSASRPAYSLVDLGAFLDRCIAHNIVPIVMLADQTCNSDVTVLNSQLVPWWTQSNADPAKDVVGTLLARSQYLILNLANELGFYQWASDPTTALNAYVQAYSSAISSLRAAGLNMPLMIDAPDCGTNIAAFTTSGAALVAADPLKNLLLSVHAYWAAYDGRPLIPTAETDNLPLIFGEIANKQDGDTYCEYDLDGTHEGTGKNTTGFTYQSFLTSLLTDEIGWLAWSWHPDSCAARNMSTDGTIAALTAYGNDIINNATYGLKKTAVITPATRRLFSTAAGRS